jgi:hypothetical protein
MFMVLKIEKQKGAVSSTSLLPFSKAFNKHRYIADDEHVAVGEMASTDILSNNS